MKPPTLPLTVVATLVTCSLLNLHSAQVDESFSAQVNGTVHAISIDSAGAILIGGEFSDISGAPAANLARLAANGALESGSTFSTDGAVLAIAAQTDGSALIAGAFNSPATHIARLLPDGKFSTLPIGSSTSSRIDCLAVGAQNSIYLGGRFRRLADAPAIYAARLTSVGAVDPTFNSSLLSTMSLEAGSDAMAVQDDGKLLVGGNFNTASGFSSLIRLNADGSIDSGFSAENGAILYPKVIQVLETGKIIVAGVANSSGTGFVRRLNPDGSVDSSFSEAHFNNCVEAVAIASDGTLLVGGSFSGGLARLQADGSQDSTWNITTDGLVKAISFQGEEAVVIAGAYKKIGAHTRSGIARITLKSQALFATNTNGRFNASLQGEAGKSYEVQASTDLTNWTVVGTTVATESGIALQDNSTGTQTLRFFRARLLN